MNKEQHLERIKEIAPKVLPEIQERSAERLEALDAFNASFQGVVIAFKQIRSGQARPYADSVDEYQILAYQPNSYTTQEPAGRTFTREQILALAQIVTNGFEMKAGWNRYLESLTKLKAPGGIGDIEGLPEPDDRGVCWRLVLRTPFTD